MLGSLASQLGVYQLGSIPSFGVVTVEPEAEIDRFELAFGSWVGLQPVLMGSSVHMQSVMQGAAVGVVKIASGSSVDVEPPAAGSGVDVLPFGSESAE